MIRTRIMLDTEWLICLVFWYHCTVHGGENRNRSGRDGTGSFNFGMSKQASSNRRNLKDRIMD